MPAVKRAQEPSPALEPIEERIRQRAYELYVERGNESGSEFEDWLQAESEVLAQIETAHRKGPRRTRRRDGAE